MKVLVANRQRAIRVSAALLRRAALWTMRHEHCPRAAEVSIAVVDDATIMELNRRYLRRNRSTDVLAFPQNGPGSLLGDVVISADRAAVQARRYRHPLSRELRLLVIHGILHLLGYDDTTPAAARQMRRQQRALLRALEAERRDEAKRRAR